MIADSKTPAGSSFHRIHTIVQLTPEFEGKFRKADPYFPNVVGDTWTLQPENEGDLPALDVKLTKQTKIETMSCIRSEITVRAANNSVQEFPVTHLLYTSWPDHGVPEDPGSLLRFVRYAEEVNGGECGTIAQEQPPIVVGCSAGIGRTGTFIAISSLMQSAHVSNWKPQSGVSELPTSPINSPALGPYSEDLIVAEIDWLREQRGGMVQKREQMELIYRLLRAA
jgi:protein-tyrosine phosphatase